VADGALDDALTCGLVGVLELGQLEPAVERGLPDARFGSGVGVGLLCEQGGDRHLHLPGQF